MLERSVHYLLGRYPVADSVEGFLAELPAVGSEATQVVNYLDQFTKSLNALNSALQSA